MLMSALASLKPSIRSLGPSTIQITRLCALLLRLQPEALLDSLHLRSTSRRESGNETELETRAKGALGHGTHTSHARLRGQGDEDLSLAHRSGRRYGYLWSRRAPHRTAKLV